MSIQILKAGIFDSIQDTGRYGWQHLGINPGGEMDQYSAQIANAVLGKDLHSAIIELHFPASQILFEKENVICITGADLSPSLNDRKIPMAQPVIVKRSSILKFEKIISGARCYLSFLTDFDLEKWLGSYSTNFKAEAGGYKGRRLQKGDQLGFKNEIDWGSLTGKDINVLPWKINPGTHSNEVRFIKGPEWDWLTDDSKKLFGKQVFTITNNSDRMGYRLKGEGLKTSTGEQLISSPVTFGTIQLLPDGQLIILMADHQTTGGYPRIGNVINIDLPILAQKRPGEDIVFKEVDLSFAEEKLAEQNKYLQELKGTCRKNIENFFTAKGAK